MTGSHGSRAGVSLQTRDRPSGPEGGSDAAFFHELDAWTEYWDLYHPETRGHYYFGDADEPGLFEALMPQRRESLLFAAWKAHALGVGSANDFERCASDPVVASAAAELDDLVADIFGRHFGDPAEESVRRAYLTALHRFATDTLPPATYRLELVPAGDPRRRTAGRHTMDVDTMWFVWALAIETAQRNGGSDARRRLRALLLAGVATGCSANFAWRGHRRTREEYAPDDGTERELRRRGLAWSTDYAAAAAEVHALFQIREWGVANVVRSDSEH